ncbi:MAG: nickel pincer cofactor biosynthesis protein LarB [Candidatus Omnitrophica bacterium]|nr:nickel pincer cofactor biosynthesis protein LarB [Candidatus Omnitrophota bacterium]MDD5352575.1 nickel pincer cofactor biosynthesis protein LarB [Candidatus Omnitrophota bacterium]MDD5550173.1 nickel pincer cofactor biosynthesis protein LarB [Candidatus Omnitrophota bacterium]
MKKKGFVDLKFAKVDIDRQARRGFSEAIYCENKSKEQIAKILSQFIKYNQKVIFLTRLDREKFLYLKSKFPFLQYNETARFGFLKKNKIKNKNREVLVLSAGTIDIPVAEEAVLTLEIMGNKVRKVYDVGVAGTHRILNHLEFLRKANVIVVVAGMEAALASLVSGLVKAPVIAVPTSCGYGANFKGLSALLTMINSCSPGIAVVNIDNGFGAGYIASLINNR